MKRFVTAVLFSAIAMVQARAQAAPPSASSDSKPNGSGPGSAANGLATTTSPDIPPAPSGKSTVFGGEIRSLDAVRDQLTLKVAGEHPLKILFDERTQVYRDGQRVSLRELKPEEHASVQTTLDGTKLFALSIHMLSNPETGEYEGRVLSFSPSTGVLEVSSGQSRQTLQVLVQGNTAFARKGQASSSPTPAGPSDLVPGALVALEFGAAGKQLPSARSISILAVPGTNFVFSGGVTSLDMHAGLLVLVDPRDQKSYQVSFNPGNFAATQELHVGDNVRVVATYDGTHYVATELAKE